MRETRREGIAGTAVNDVDQNVNEYIRVVVLIINNSIIIRTCQNKYINPNSYNVKSN